LPGSGKTSFAATCPNPGFVAGETGHGNGLLPVAEGGFDYVIPKTYADLKQIATGGIFADKDTIVIDGMSEICQSIIKDEALTVPRRLGDSEKRRMGVPERDDYQVMGELSRRFLRQLLQLDKHIIITCLLRMYQPPDPKENQKEKIGGPDLPGELAVTIGAMVDHVLWLKTRPAMRNNDPKQRYLERYFDTVGSSQYIAKSRSTVSRSQILAPEIVFDIQADKGTFADLYRRVEAAYGKV
jgi:hypothetical protein